MQSEALRRATARARIVQRERSAEALAYARRWKAEGRYEQAAEVYPLAWPGWVTEPGQPTDYGGPTANIRYARGA